MSRKPSLLLAFTTLLLSTSAVRADDVPAPTYAVRVYEVFQRGNELRIEERTSKAFAPRHVRSIEVGQLFPAEGQPGLKVYKNRDSHGFFGALWREDGVPDGGVHVVEITEEAADEPGVALVRVRIVERASPGVAPTRSVRHPEHDDAQRGVSAGK